jgi:hypothetical protein
MNNPETLPCVHANVHTGAQFGYDVDTPPELFAECLDCGAKWSATGVRTS